MYRLQYCALKSRVTICHFLEPFAILIQMKQIKQMICDNFLNKYLIYSWAIFVVQKSRYLQNVVQISLRHCKNTNIFRAQTPPSKVFPFIWITKCSRENRWWKFSNQHGRRKKAPTTLQTIKYHKVPATSSRKRNNMKMWNFFRGEIRRFQNFYVFQLQRHFLCKIV